MAEWIDTFSEIFKNLWEIFKSIFQLIFKLFIALTPILNLFVMFLNGIAWICTHILEILELGLFTIFYLFEKLVENFNSIMKSILDLINVPLEMINTLISYISHFLGYIFGYLYIIFSFANYSTDDEVLF